MSLADRDRELVVSELGREPTRAEAALFENLWSEHCAYRSSRPLLSAFDSEGEQVVVGPGDDAAVVALPDSESGDGNGSTYITMGIESHNHPSYVDPVDGAATGVGGIVQDTLSMGAYPIALADSLYFGEFDDDHSQYLFEGVVEGISHYGNCIGVPTVAGSVDFHPDYEGNPLVNVACVGLTNEERLVTAKAQEPGNTLVLVGNATGRDGLGGASFASEDLAEDAETADRPAVQVGDPYAEKLLIEANEQLVDEGLIESARDLGAAGLGGASSEMVAKADLGARIELERVHQREPNMNAMEILLAESQERMCYEVKPENVDRVHEIVERFDLGCSVIGEVTDENYTCLFEGETVVDVDAYFLGEGAPMNDLATEELEEPETDLPDADLEAAFDAIVSSPNTASKRWVYRQYDHEVGVRTSVGPGDDAAIIAVREAEQGLAISSGAAPNWTTVAPYEGLARSRSRTRRTSRRRAQRRWPRWTASTAATRRSRTSTAASPASSTASRRCARRCRRRSSAGTSRCITIPSRGRFRRRRRWRWSAPKTGTMRRRCRSSPRAIWSSSVISASSETSPGSVAPSTSRASTAAIGSQACPPIPRASSRRWRRSRTTTRRWPFTT